MSTNFLLTVFILCLIWYSLCSSADSFKVDPSASPSTRFTVHSMAESIFEANGDDNKTSSFHQNRPNVRGALCRGKKPSNGSKTHRNSSTSTPLHSFESNSLHNVGDRSLCGQWNTPGGNCCGNAPFQGDLTHPPSGKAILLLTKGCTPKHQLDTDSSCSFSVKSRKLENSKTKNPSPSKNSRIIIHPNGVQNIQKLDSNLQNTKITLDKSHTCAQQKIELNFDKKTSKY